MPGVESGHSQPTDEREHDAVNAEEQAYAQKNSQEIVLEMGQEFRRAFAGLGDSPEVAARVTAMKDRILEKGEWALEDMKIRQEFRPILYEGKMSGKVATLTSDLKQLDETVEKWEENVPESNDEILDLQERSFRLTNELDIARKLRAVGEASEKLRMMGKIEEVIQKSPRILAGLRARQKTLLVRQGYDPKDKEAHEELSVIDQTIFDLEELQLLEQQRRKE